MEKETFTAPNGLEVSIDATPNFYKDYTLEQMESKEQEIIAEIEKTEKDIKEHFYELKRSSDYPRQKIGIDIANFLSRTECTWEYTKGMYDLISFWKSSSLKITY